MADIQDVEKWCLIAQVFGFNELAKQQDTLGRKVFCRLARNSAERKLQGLGVKLEVSQDKVVLVLSDYVPHIEFTEKDLDLMRKEIASRDKG